MKNKTGILVLVLLSLSATVFGQQAIFNVPSSAILDRGNVYLELDATFKVNSQNGLGRFSSFVPRIVIGVGWDVEVGVNLNGNIQPGADSTTSFRP